MVQYTGSNSISSGVPTQYKSELSVDGVSKQTGLYLAKVVDTVDDRYEGFIYVEIIGDGYLGDPTTKASRHEYTRVRRASPYGGSYQFANATNTYGMSCHPPAPGSQVLIAMPANSPVGIMLGVLPDVTRNASFPTNPGAFVDSENDVVGPTQDPSVKKAQDKNKRPRASTDTIRNERGQEHGDKWSANGEAITGQGIGLDSVRGLSSSSARRESPTNVFGFNTPGGHSFVMDDGTLPNSDTCLTPDKARKGGLSNLVRLGSAGGAQVLMHDGAGIIYIISQTGKTWIQLGSDGKLDIYSGDQISMHTETDFNLYCGGDINMDADNINMKARGSDGISIESSSGEFNLHSAKDIKLTTDLNGHIKAVGNIRISTDGLIDLNGPQATAATKTVAKSHPTNRTVKESINPRVPEAEPWGGHAEEQEMLPQVASADDQFTAQDIDMSQITNRQQPNADNISVEKKPTTNPRKPQL